MFSWKNKKNISKFKFWLKKAPLLEAMKDTFLMSFIIYMYIYILLLLLLLLLFFFFFLYYV